VTGTSGKGSVTTYLHSILHAAGKRVGSTASPHPSIITERWKIGNKHMSKTEFAEIVTWLKPQLDEYIRTSPYDMLSFFELTEVIGFLYFKRHKIDWVILEVGCGGRYDSTNIIPHKDVAVITNIGLDHVGIIGNNKAEIAYEKSGIIKKGCAMFTSERDKKMIGIIEDECKKQKVDLKISNFKFQISNSSFDKTTFEYNEKFYTLSTIGPHQIKNAIRCIDSATHLGIPTKAIQKGLQKAKQPLRMEVISENPTVILDGAHNVDKIKSTVAASLQVCKSASMQPDIHLIVGMSGNKELAKMVKHLATLNPKTIALTRTTTNAFRKTASLPELRKMFKKYCTNTPTIELFLDPMDAYTWTKKHAHKRDIILATGSIYMTGELRGKLK